MIMCVCIYIYIYTHILTGRHIDICSIHLSISLSLSLYIYIYYCMRAFREKQCCFTTVQHIILCTWIQGLSPSVRNFADRTLRADRTPRGCSVDTVTDFGNGNGVCESCTTQSEAVYIYIYIYIHIYMYIHIYIYICTVSVRSTDFSYEEFTGLAETRLAQNTFNRIKIA